MNSNPPTTADYAFASASDANRKAIVLEARVTRLEEMVAVLALKRINDAIELIVRYGGIEGDHHKAWVLDQAVRILAGDRYTQIVADACDGEDGPNTYTWEEGIAP